MLFYLTCFVFLVFSNCSRAFRNFLKTIQKQVNGIRENKYTVRTLIITINKEKNQPMPKSQPKSK